MVQITDKITALLSNSPTRALAEAVKVVTQRPGQQWHRQSHFGQKDKPELAQAAAPVCKTLPKGLETLGSTFHRELFNENKNARGFLPHQTLLLKTVTGFP